MNKGNRKHILPLALVMSLAVVGMMAAFIALAVQPGTVAAQTDPCDGTVGAAAAAMPGRHHHADAGPRHNACADDASCDG